MEDQIQLTGNQVAGLLKVAFRTRAMSGVRMWKTRANNAELLHVKSLGAEWIINELGEPHQLDREGTVVRHGD